MSEVNEPVFATLQTVQLNNYIEKAVNQAIPSTSSAKIKPKNNSIDATALETWRNNFQEKYLKKYLNKNNSDISKDDKVSANSSTYLREDVNRIIKLLNNDADHGFSKSQAIRKKNKGYVLNKGILNMKMKNNEILPIICIEDFFDTLYQLHAIDRGHFGMAKSFDDVAGK